MVVRKLNLSEWFLRYQLLGIQKHHLHNPFFMDVDISQLAFTYRNKTRTPITALVIKAAAMLQKEIPASHRVLIPTLFGPRLLQFTDAKVNVPLIVEINGKQILAATVINDALTKSPLQIQSELSKKKIFDKKQFPIAGFISKRKNTFFNRCILRILYLLAYRTTLFYRKKGGGISVSSIMSSPLSNKHIMAAPKGPTALSIGVFGLNHSSNGMPTLKLGVGYNHAALLAIDAAKALAVLSDILSGKNQLLFKQLIADDGLLQTAENSSDHKHGLRPLI